MNEHTIQTNIRLRMSELRRGFMLRYQVGTFLTMNGDPVKIGEVGVSDLIGVTGYVVKPEDVGRTIGVFTAMEVKTATGRVRDEQSGFVARVLKLGGIAGIVRSPEDAEKLISDFPRQP